MPINKINLRKLLQLSFAEPRLRRRLLLDDIRKERARVAGSNDGGGDFYTPFWADVKAHASGQKDIAEQTEIRIQKNKSRARLYPMLRDSFLDMWNEKMRWRNEPFEFVPKSVHAQLQIDSLDAAVKIENTAAIKAWDGTHRVMYPYFSEEPALRAEAARLGFWALSSALPDFRLEEFRIIDLQHHQYFRPTEVGMTGDEEAQFISRFRAVLTEWRNLRDNR
jgi:hypothetical protein